MAIIFFDGLERRIDATSGSVYPWWQLPSSGSATSHEGSDRSLICNGEINAFRDSQNVSFSVVDTYLSFYLYRTESATAGVDIARVRQASNAAKAILEWAGTDTIRLLDQAGSTLGTASTTLTINTWYRIDLRIGTGTSANYELRINNNSELSGTGDFTTGNMGNVLFNGDHCLLDDVVLDDAAYVSDGFDYTIASIFPDGVGNYTAWTGDNTDVDEVSHDGTTTEITTTNNNDAETFTLDNVPGWVPGASTVEAVMLVAPIRKTTNPVVNCQWRDRLSGTDRDSASFDTSRNDTAYVGTEIHFTVYTTKPGGGAFSISDINSCEIGLEHNQAQSRDLFCTVINANVLLTLPSGSYTQLERNFVRGTNRGIMKGVA